jgi:hypothetical protein
MIGCSVTVRRSVLLSFACAACTHHGLPVARSSHEPSPPPATSEQHPIAHLDQGALRDGERRGRNAVVFDEAYRAGESLFRRHFADTDGVGCRVGTGSRFTRVPRADLITPGNWATHMPHRTTGPNADSCLTCHAQASFEASGAVGSAGITPLSASSPGNQSVNVIRDPTRSGRVGDFIERNSAHVFGAGSLQRLAEEMTGDLHEIRNVTGRRACATMAPVSARLVAKTVDFGRIAARPSRDSPCRPILDLSRVAGVDRDLVVKPFQRKGIVRSIRAFTRDALNDELGIQAVELVGPGTDGDFDGVVDEASVGDVTALTVYVAAQPRPVTRLELDAAGLLNPGLTLDERRAIEHGERLFAVAHCTTCHVPALTLDDPHFAEPSANAEFRDSHVAAGRTSVSWGLDPAWPIRFDLTRDVPGGVVTLPTGAEVALGNLTRTSSGAAVVPLFGDLKRHEMGSALAEDVDEAGTGVSIWLTANLWGLGSTGPYMHDGRDSTITEAILDHGGEAAMARRRFAAMNARDREAMVAFLSNLTLVRPRPATTVGSAALRNEYLYTPADRALQWPQWRMP